MAVEKIEIHDRSVSSRKESVKDWEISSEDKKYLMKFLEQLELGKVNKGVKISESRQVKYLDCLKAPLEFFHKATSKITLKDIEAFERALSSGEIKSRKGEGYSQATKVDIRRTLKVLKKEDEMSVKRISEEVKSQWETTIKALEFMKKVNLVNERQGQKTHKVERLFSLTRH